MLDRINLVPRKPLSSKLKGAFPFILFFIPILVVVLIQGQKIIIEKKREKVLSEISALEFSIVNNEKLMTRYSQHKIEIAQLEEEHSAVLSRVQRLEGLHQQKRIFSDTLAGIAGSMPSSVIFKKMSFTGGSAILLGEARGYEDLPDFVEALKINGPFNTLSLTGINRSIRGGEMIFEFVLTGELIQNIQDKAGL